MNVGANTSTNLTEFLLARIAEDEDVMGFPGGLSECECGMSETRWLAECEAKRRIVEAHPIASGFTDTLRGLSRWESCAVCRDGANDWPCDTLRALALPYADHPDFREESGSPSSPRTPE